ncbi:MAG: delta-lactam-biosynthetic de-N-acetylase [Bacillota bacterium]|nr:delta-lactam-biosynthetic de-N-acetylase [Bacillota bacterium]
MFITIRKNNFLGIFACIILITIISLISSNIHQQAVATSAPVSTNWGLGFKADGQPPVGNASADFLKKYDSYYLDTSGKKVIYLTFDAGYEAGYTSHILDVLKKHKAPATFFIVGNYLETSPDLVKRMVADGDIVGNHTFHHYDMSKISDAQSFQNEITSVETLYKKITGKDMEKFYRPPQGKYSVTNLDQAKALGYKTIFWSLAYVDWYKDKQPTAQQAYDKLIPRIHPGAIVLLHSTSKTNSEILDELLTRWENMGYTFGSLKDLK